MSDVVKLIFFFQAEDGIRAGHVTGVQTCALPIYIANFVTVNVHAPGSTRRIQRIHDRLADHVPLFKRLIHNQGTDHREIGRASCRERVKIGEDGGYISNIMEVVAMSSSE